MQLALQMSSLQTGVISDILKKLQIDSDVQFVCPDRWGLFMRSADYRKFGQKASNRLDWSKDIFFVAHLVLNTEDETHFFAIYWFARHKDFYVYDSLPGAFHDYMETYRKNVVTLCKYAQGETVDFNKVHFVPIYRQLDSFSCGYRVLTIAVLILTLKRPLNYIGLLRYNLFWHIVQEEYFDDLASVSVESLSKQELMELILPGIHTFGTMVQPLLCSL